MTKTKKIYRVYRVVTDFSGDLTAWDLLTTDGENPNDTQYYMLKGDMPSSRQQDQIQEKLEEEDWQEGSLKEFGLSVAGFYFEKD